MKLVVLILFLLGNLEFATACSILDPMNMVEISIPSSTKMLRANDKKSSTTYMVNMCGTFSEHLLKSLHCDASKKPIILILKSDGCTVIEYSSMLLAEFTPLIDSLTYKLPELALTIVASDKEKLSFKEGHITLEVNEEKVYWPVHYAIRNGAGNLVFWAIFHGSYVLLYLVFGVCSELGGRSRGYLTCGSYTYRFEYFASYTVSHSIIHAIFVLFGGPLPTEATLILILMPLLVVVSFRARVLRFSLICNTQLNHRHLGRCRALKSHSGSSKLRKDYLNLSSSRNHHLAILRYHQQRYLCWGMEWVDNCYLVGSP